MKKPLIILMMCFWLLNGILFAQESFETIVHTTSSENGYGVFEDNSSNYIVLGSRNSIDATDRFKPLIVKLNQSGSIISELLIDKTDTTGYFSFGFQKPNGNYYLIGALSNAASPDKYNIAYKCEIDQELNIIWEKYFTIPAPFRTHSISNFLITPENHVLVQGIADSSEYSYDYLLYISLFDMEGDLVKFKMYDNWKNYSVNRSSEMLFIPDSTNFLLVGGNVEYSFPRDWVEFDSELNLLDHGDVEDSLSYFLSPLSVVRLADGNFFAANKSYGIEIPSQGDLELRIMDNEFKLIKDTIIYFEENKYLALHNGAAYVNQNSIWVCAFTNALPHWSGTETYQIFNFDSQLHVNGWKDFGGDRRFWLYQVVATSDGGCIVVGIIPETNGSIEQDIYINKIVPEDVITGIDESCVPEKDQLSVIPNPFSNEIFIETELDDYQFLLFNMDGRIVFKKQHLNTGEQHLSTKHLPPGIYIYSYSSKNRLFGHGKLVKF